MKQFKCRDLSTEEIERQLNIFERGISPLNLVRPATINDGILRLSLRQETELTHSFPSRLAGKKPVKFVPASGAASRMFDFLHQFNLRQHQRGTQGQEDSAPNKQKELHSFFRGLRQQKFAFSQDIRIQLLKDNINMDTLIDQADFYPIVKTIMDPKALNFPSQPKALLKFHRYGDRARNALEEHLFEAREYACDGNGRAHLCFTMSADSQALARRYLEGVKSRIGHREDQFEINFSQQETWTNTIAADEENKPVLDEMENIITRPGGHGALIENLNSIEADIIFIKNIDNVAHENHTRDTIKYKKILASYLLKIQQQMFDYLFRLKQPEIDSESLAEISSFVAGQLDLTLPASSTVKPPQPIKEQLFNLLNRPIRVCGMVKNAGEPGGGPFWIRDECENESLHIVEAIQVDRQSREQNLILSQSTHFNPVDIVCGVKDYQGNKFDLRRFVDPNQYMISKKFLAGKSFRVLEYPGLWNGAMAHWITIFIEVPTTTFNPVKTVNDLLRTLHQP